MNIIIDDFGRESTLAAEREEKNRRKCMGADSRWEMIIERIALRRDLELRCEKQGKRVHGCGDGGLINPVRHAHWRKAVVVREVC